MIKASDPLLHFPENILPNASTLFSPSVYISLRPLSLKFALGTLTILEIKIMRGSSGEWLHLAKAELIYRSII